MAVMNNTVGRKDNRNSYDSSKIVIDLIPWVVGYRVSAVSFKFGLESTPIVEDNRFDDGLELVTD